MVSRDSTARFGAVDAPRHSSFDILPRVVGIRFHVRFGKNAHEEHHGIWIGCSRSLCLVAHHLAVG